MTAMSAKPRTTATPDAPATAHAFDVLSDVAEAFRLRGSCSGTFTLTAPWGYSVPGTKDAALLVVTRGRVHFELEGPKRRVLELAPGDVVALPHGNACNLRSDARTPLRPIEEIEERLQLAPEKSRGGQTEMIALCCELVSGRTNPLLGALPPLIHCPGSDGNVARWLDPTVRLLAAESASTTPGRATILNRLAEVVFIQLIRAWVASRPESDSGWLGALRDPQLGAALAAIHSQPGASWTVATLASRASMSRSAFASRFRSVVGETPFDYVTRWRVQHAARLIDEGHVPLKEIVAISGYASEAAFRTVFRKWVGVTPGKYRAKETVRRVDARDARGAAQRVGRSTPTRTQIASPPVRRGARTLH